MILATTKVKDLDHCLEVFSTAGADKRGSHGSAGATVYRDPIEEDRVWAVFGWDEEGWTCVRHGPGDPRHHAGGRPPGPDRPSASTWGRSAPDRSDYPDLATFHETPAQPHGGLVCHRRGGKAPVGALVRESPHRSRDCE